MTLFLLYFLSPIVSLEASNLFDFVDHLRQRSVKEVVIYPQVIIESEQGYRVAREKPQSMQEMLRLHNELARYSGESLKLLPSDDLKKAMQKYRVDDLRDPEALGKVLEQCKADAIILGIRQSSFHDADSMMLRALVVDRGAQEKTPIIQVRRETRPTISDLAFAGKSFEIRRWNDNDLNLVGFIPPMDRGIDALGLGKFYEEKQAAHLRRSMRHPLADKSFPFPIAFFVNGQRSTLLQIQNDFYLPLSPNDRIQLRVHNSTQHDALMAFYLDGENTIGKQIDHPFTTPSERHWVLPPQKTRSVGRWLTQGEHNDAESALIVTETPESTAETTLDSKPGMITIIFYTSGTAGLKLPPERSTRGVNIEAGKWEPIEKRRKPGKKGLMMASITIYYRSPEEIESLTQRSGTN